MSREDRLEAWVRLLRAPGIGNAGLMQLLRRFGCVENICQANAAVLQSAGISAATVNAIIKPNQKQVAADLAWLMQTGNGLLTLDQAAYPSLLQEISDPPIALFYSGDLDLLSYPLLAIVGSRTATRGGIQNAHNFAAELATCGLGVLSGLALGIDAAAHRGALDAGGITVAVMGTGLNLMYPAANQDLAQRIASEGLLLSEYPPGTKAHPGHFPRRNRIIAGLAHGALVVEAAERSGSLITARLSSEAGREVFAIPGSIHNPLARGTHKLIRQGAKLVENTTDILEELTSKLTATISASTLQQGRSSLAAGDALEVTFDSDYLLLLKEISHDPVNADTLIERTGLTPEAVSSMLLLLELSGKIESLPGNRYCRITTGTV